MRQRPGTLQYCGNAETLRFFLFRAPKKRYIFGPRCLAVFLQELQDAIKSMRFAVCDLKTRRLFAIAISWDVELDS